MAGPRRSVRRYNQGYVISESVITKFYCTSFPPTDNNWALTIVCRIRWSELFCAILCATVVSKHKHTYPVHEQFLQSTMAYWCRFVLVLGFCIHFCVFFFLLAIVSMVKCTSAVDYMERLVSEMTYYVRSLMLNCVHSSTVSYIKLMTFCVLRPKTSPSQLVISSHLFLSRCLLLCLLTAFNDWLTF